MQVSGVGGVGFGKRARRGVLRGVVALLLAAGPAAAQQPADWRTAAPVLPLDGPVRRATAPVALGGTAWGPWRRICREQVLRAGQPPQRDCVAVEQVRAEGDAARLTLLHESGLRMSVLRTADGRIAAFDAVRADGTAPPADPRRSALVEAWRDQFATLSLQQRRIAPAESFALPIDGSTRGGTCRVDGLAAIGRRPVLVARCAVELAGRLRGGESEARVAIFARVAVDVATGMVAAQGYATRIETFGAGGRSNGVVVTPSRILLDQGGT